MWRKHEHPLNNYIQLIVLQLLSKYHVVQVGRHSALILQGLDGAGKRLCEWSTRFVLERKTVYKTGALANWLCQRVVG